MPTVHVPASAADLKVRLEALQTERAAAALNGLVHNGLYMADLDHDVRATSAAFTGAAVTEIALLRAALDGPLQG